MTEIMRQVWGKKHPVSVTSEGDGSGQGTVRQTEEYEQNGGEGFMWKVASEGADRRSFQVVRTRVSGV